MTNAEHIIAWAENDRTIYERLCNFEARREAISPAPNTIARAAYEIAASAYQAGRLAGGIADSYSPADILDATKLVLVWTVEG